MARNTSAAAGYSKPGHHEADPGAWMRIAPGPVPAVIEDGVVVETPNEDRYQIAAEPLWDWDYLTRPNHELWIAEWEEWPNNMEGD